MTRKEAKVLGEIKYQGKPCKNGHSGIRYVCNKQCVKCEYERIKKRAESGYFNEWRARTEYEKKRCQDPKRKEWKREWSKSEKGTESRRRYEKANREMMRYKSMKKYTRTKKAMPSWADEDSIKAVYREARWIEICTGIKCHVDHIVPIQGERVSGLHVPWNLQILEASENIAKSNIYM
jgi:hypothetical protein